MDYTVTIQEETEKVTQAVVHKSVEITDGQYGHYIYKTVSGIDNIPSRFVEHPVTRGDMSIFFCLFLKASNCLKEIDYELTEIQRSKIEALKSQTNLSLRESFERLVRIFFS